MSELDLERSALTAAVAKALEGPYPTAPTVANILRSERVREIGRALERHRFGDCSQAGFCTHETWDIAVEMVDLSRGAGDAPEG